MTSRSCSSSFYCLNVICCGFVWLNNFEKNLLLHTSTLKHISVLQSVFFSFGNLLQLCFLFACWLIVCLIYFVLNSVSWSAFIALRVNQLFGPTLWALSCPMLESYLPALCLHILSLWNNQYCRVQSNYLHCSEFVADLVHGGAFLMKLWLWIQP